MALSFTANLVRTTKIARVHGLFYLQSAAVFVLQFFEEHSDKRSNVYNMLWVLVFGFATVNILGLVARRFEPRRSNLNFGEILAITVVFVSIFLLSWEMLYLFHIFPIKLQPR